MRATAAWRRHPSALQKSNNLAKAATPDPAHGVITLPVAGTRGIPRSGVTAAVLNFTVAGPTATGYLTAYPSGTARPVASTVNFSTHTLANQVLVSAGSDGAVSIYNGSSAPENVVVDASGFVGPIPGPLTWSGRTGLIANAEDSSVSCPSASFCMASQNSSVLRYNGSTWSAPQLVSSGFGLDKLSCTSSAFCIGIDEDAAYVYKSGTWTRTTISDDQTGLYSVSCVSSTFCMVGGLNDDFAAGWVYNGTTWKVAATGLPHVDNQFHVSCTSASFCAGIDEHNHASTFNGSTWRPVAFPLGSEDLSCVSASFCLDSADGDYSTFNGTTWSTPASLGLAADAKGTVGVSSVSCATSTSCVAISDDGNAELYDGTAWTNELAIDPKLPLDSVSCPTASFCMAADANAAIVGR